MRPYVPVEPEDAADTEKATGTSDDAGCWYDEKFRFHEGVPTETATDP